MLGQVVGAMLAIGGVVVGSWAWGLGGLAAVAAIGTVVQRKVRRVVA